MPSLANYEYERRAGQCFSSCASIAFRQRHGRLLRRCRLLLDNLSGCRSDFEELLSGSADDGLISDEEWAELGQADAVMSGFDGDATVYFVGEISLTVYDDDIHHAIERAAILRKATSCDVWPMVIGETVAEPQRQKAHADGVSFAEVEW